MNAMIDKQMQFFAWLVTTAIDKCQSLEEERRNAKRAARGCCNKAFKEGKGRM